jgi:hypothetical protein
MKEKKEKKNLSAFSTGNMRTRTTRKIIVPRFRSETNKNSHRKEEKPSLPGYFWMSVHVFRFSHI